MRINDNGVDRDMTPDEEATYMLTVDAYIATEKTNEIIRKANQDRKQGILDRIGLTADELKLLLS